MAFFGKKFKRTSAEGLLELMDAMQVDQKMRDFAKASGSTLTTFFKNDDGTYGFTVEKDGKPLFTNSFRLNEEVDFKRPDGVMGRAMYRFEGNKLIQTLNDPAGRHMTFTREFTDNSLTMTITVAELDAKATMRYEAV